MAQWKRTSSEVVTRVVEERLNSLDYTGQDIATKLQEEGIEVSKDTVYDILNRNLPKLSTESQKVAELVDRNDNLMSIADKRLKEMLENGEETIRVSDLVSVRDSAWKQNQLIGWKATERIELGLVPPEEQNRLLRLL